jgi:hypothetical protein
VLVQDEPAEKVPLNLSGVLTSIPQSPARD